MKLAYIAPTCALNQVSSLGNIEFCLAPYALKDKKYKQYFIDAKEKGRYVIMDNGVAENDLIDDNKMTDLAIEMKVDELVIPDTIGNYEKTIQQREEFLIKYYYKLKKSNIKLQSVIQGNTYSEYLCDYEQLEQNEFIDVIGIPFRMDYCWANDANSREQNGCFNRVLFVATVANGRKPIHLLGCNCSKEIFLFNEVSRIRSMDSKLMCRYGKAKRIYDSEDTEKPTEKIYINDKLTKAQIKCAVKNIIKLKRRLINGK
jgi:hypothetical protein